MLEATSSAIQLGRTFYCPEPLVYSNYSDNDDYYILWALEAKNCALPCPSLTYTPPEWNLLVNILLALTSFCLVAAIMSAVILCTNVKKFYVKLMFTSGFLWSSLVSIIFFLVNYDNDVICEGESRFRRKDPFCVFQAITLLFFFLWIQIWGIFLSLETYFFFLSKNDQKTIQWCRQYYTRVAFLLPTVLVIIPLANGNLGFDPYANMPVCLFLFHDNKNYFWFGLFIPFNILNFICSVITIFSIRRINEIFVTANQTKNVTNKSNSGTISANRSKPKFGRESSLSISEYSENSGFESSVLQASLIDSEVLSSCYSLGQERMVNESTDFSLHGYGDTKYAVYDDDHDDLDSAMDRDSFGQHLRRHQDEDPRHSLDDPFSPDDSLSYIHHASSTKNNIVFDESRCKSYSYSHSDSYEDEHIDMDSSAEEKTVKTRHSTGSWFMSTFSALTKNSKPNKMVSALKKTLRYNGRSIVFIVTFCLSTLYIAILLFILNKVQYHENVKGTEDYAQCLILASIQSPIQTQEDCDAYAQQQCGQYPSVRPNKYLFFSILVWAYGYGIIPCYVFSSSSTLLANFKSRCQELYDKYFLKKNKESDHISADKVEVG